MSGGGGPGGGVGDLRPGILPTLAGVICGAGALAPVLTDTGTGRRTVLAVVAGVGALALAASGLNPHVRGLRVVAAVCGAVGLGAVAVLAATYLRAGGV